MNHSRQYIKTGLTGVSLVNIGTHICHFFKDQQELVKVIVPYLKAGLLGNEKCICVTSDRFLLLPQVAIGKTQATQPNSLSAAVANLPEDRQRFFVIPARLLHLSQGAVNIPQVA